MMEWKKAANAQPSANKTSKMKAWKTNKTNIYDLFNFRVYFYQRGKTILAFYYLEHILSSESLRTTYFAIKWNVFVFLAGESGIDKEDFKRLN